MMNFILNSQILSMSIVVGFCTLAIYTLCKLDVVENVKVEEVKLYTENIFQER